MGDHSVAIDMESLSSTSVTTPRCPPYLDPPPTSPVATPATAPRYPPYQRDLDPPLTSPAATPGIVHPYRHVVTPYPLLRRGLQHAPFSRHQSEDPLHARLPQEVMASRPISFPDSGALRAMERAEPNYPTRPVFTVDPSSSLPLYSPRPPQPARSTSSRCQCSCGNTARKMSRESASVLDDEPTSEDLSWRRLHMSRAKLKATATTSELLSGFAMVAMVELQINNPTNVPEWLFVMFSVCTTVLVAVHIFALMISTYLLPNIDAVSKLHVRGLVAESPHERMRGFIELAWAFSTVLGLFLFLVEVAILCWVKFWDYSFTAAWAATIIVIPVLVVFIAFAVHFYHNLVVYKVKSSGSDLRQLEELKLRLDNAATGLSGSMA